MTQEACWPLLRSEATLKPASETNIIPDPSGSHRAQGEATLQSLLGKAQLSAENRGLTIMSVISAAADLPVVGGHHRHPSERS